MGYYDYDFSKMLEELEDLNVTQSNAYSEVLGLRQDLATYQSNITTVLNTLTVITVISVAVKVLFR